MGPARARGPRAGEPGGHPARARGGGAERESWVGTPHGPGAPSVPARPGRAARCQLKELHSRGQDPA